MSGIRSISSMTSLIRAAGSLASRQARQLPAIARVNTAPDQGMQTQQANLPQLPPQASEPPRLTEFVAAKLAGYRSSHPQSTASLAEQAAPFAPPPPPPLPEQGESISQVLKCLAEQSSSAVIPADTDANRDSADNAASAVKQVPANKPPLKPRIDMNKALSESKQFQAAKLKYDAEPEMSSALQAHYQQTKQDDTAGKQSSPSSPAKTDPATGAKNKSADFLAELTANKLFTQRAAKLNQEAEQRAEQQAKKILAANKEHKTTGNSSEKQSSKAIPKGPSKDLNFIAELKSMLAEKRSQSDDD